MAFNILIVATIMVILLALDLIMNVLGVIKQRLLHQLLCFPHKLPLTK